MERYDLLYRLYEEFEADTLRELQDFVDLFPPVDSRIALDYWQDASDELESRKDAIRSSFAAGDAFAEIAARSTRDQTFTALDLHSKYGRAVNALVLDVDETLRSAGRTDNEIPRDTLHLLTEFHEAGVPIVICTGQTLENVKGFTIQGLGNELVHSGDVSIVYEAGTGVFTPGHGSTTKQLLYEDLDPTVREVFSEVRSRVLPQAPDDLRESVHLQGNEFNITLKPNFDIGSDPAEAVIDEGLVYLVDLLGRAVAAAVDGDFGVESAEHWSRAYYADADPEVADVLAAEDAAPECEVDDVPDPIIDLFDRIDVAYYHADAAEIGSLELNKPNGVQAALDVLGVDDPFVLVMGDSKSDLRVMEWAAEADAGIAAAPKHASQDVLTHVLETDELVYDRGDAASMLRTVYVLNLLDER
ncbi:had superfamily hydrolase [Halogeometricum borinquense DSM 11551]|uniref:Had superfamily hydrolase n=2 Tax=Halogeometricum borinquense TaxID=60847 RepID=E4NMA4_HALBP|nr:HAD hydrolase family protein [Halogeometricum borinquense]ADQ67309.1 predicted HAD superfamily hydrolase [Halogeometricum borinquense DSM 11551]ELY28524.1 had superfamily hydrolase [Halogeometricum borinquense DSM 11551]RYJ13679.1 HAD family hydrolase [Halogeometricum borinquense]